MSVVRRVRRSLLHRSPPLFELTDPLVVLVARPIRPRRGHGYTVNTEIDAEDRLGLGIYRIIGRRGLVVSGLGADVGVELVDGLD